MKAIDAQGAVFVAAALMTAAASLLLPRSGHAAELVVVALLVLVAGVPHGALDTLLARRLHRVQGAGAWLLFALAYLLLAAAVVALWRVMPAVFLVGFLLVSAFHFSGDPRAGTTLAARVLYGGAIIVLPFVRHAAETTDLFAALAGRDAAEGISIVLRWMSLPWLLALGAVAVHAAILRQWWSALEIAALAVLGVLAPPLVAFAVFFCTMHGARHVLRSAESESTGSWRTLARATLPPMAAVVVLAAIGWALLDDATFDQRIVQLLFVGLAALTVPHMLLVERLRFRRDPGFVDG